MKDPMADDELDEIFSKMNGSGAHACYCQRSEDGGCTCAIKDEYVVEAKAAINAYTTNKIIEARIDEIERIINMAAISDRNVDIRLAELRKTL